MKKFSFFSKSGKYEEASELFKKAANQYKVAQYWPEAGKAFSRAAECFIALGENHDAATSYVDAAVCMKKVGIDNRFYCSLIWTKLLNCMRKQLLSIAIWVVSLMLPS